MAALHLSKLAATAVISTFAFGVSGAAASVQVDPHGPAGQQYALPVDSVRGEVAGKPSAGVPGARTPAPLFGQGIQPLNRTGDKKNKGREPRGGKYQDGSGVDGNSAINKSDPELEALVNGTGGSSSGMLDIALLIGGMALIGLTAGLLGRRTLSRPAPLLSERSRVSRETRP